MAKNSGAPRLTDSLLQVAAFLKQADKLVRERSYVSALEQIAKARAKDPGNSYAEAYEQRVKLLVNALGENKQTKNSSRNFDSPAPHSFSQHLESIANLAILEAHRTANLSLQQEGSEKPKSGARTVSPDFSDPDPKVQRETLENKEAQVHSCIRAAEELLGKRHLDEALNTLAPAILIDPLNEAILGLEHRIRDAQEEEILSRLQRHQEGKEEVHRIHEVSGFDIQNCIVHATQLAERKKFSEALMVIGQGYLLDPFNLPLAMCEKIVLAAIADESRHARPSPPGNSAFVVAGNERQTESKTVILGYLDKAQSLLSEDRIADSLAQVALAMIAVQKDAEADQKAQEMSAQSNRVSSAMPEHHEESNSVPDAIDDGSRQIFGLLDKAKRHAGKAEYESALEDLLQASYLIPSDGSLERLDRIISQKFMEFYQLMRSTKADLTAQRPSPSVTVPSREAEAWTPDNARKSPTVTNPQTAQRGPTLPLRVEKQIKFEDESADAVDDSVTRTKEHLMRSLRHLNVMRLIEASVEGELASLVDSSKHDVGQYAIAVSNLARKAKGHTTLNEMHDQYETVRQQARDLIHSLCYQEILDGIENVLNVMPANQALLKRREEVEMAFDSSKRSIAGRENTKRPMVDSERKHPAPERRTRKHSIDQMGLNFSDDLDSGEGLEEPRDDENLRVPEPVAMQKTMRKSPPNSPYLGN